MVFVLGSEVSAEMVRQFSPTHQEFPEVLGFSSFVLAVAFSNSIYFIIGFLCLLSMSTLMTGQVGSFYQ